MISSWPDMISTCMLKICVESIWKTLEIIFKSCTEKRLVSEWMEKSKWWAGWWASF